MRVMILYEHCSPHQVTAVEAARRHFSEHGHHLVATEFYSRSHDYGWTFGDKPRPDEWRCLFPGKERVSNGELYRAISDLVKQQQIDVLAVNGWYGLYAWWLLFRKKSIGCRMVMVSDSVVWDFPRTWFKEMPKRWLMRRVDAAFVAGTPQTEYLQSLGLPAEQMAMGNDVVDNALYDQIPLRTVPLGRKAVIGTAARLIPKKNLAEAIKSFAAVLRKRSVPDLEWRIAGRGPLESELKQIVSDEQVPVVFEGFVGYHDMPGFYAGLDLYWQPSFSEPWGLVVNEAMAAGLPVLVSDRCGCATDLVQPENGWIHSVERAGMIAGLEKAIAQCEAWPQMGQASRSIIRRWGIERFAEGLLHSCQLATQTGQQPHGKNV